MTASAGDTGPITRESHAREYRPFIVWCVLAGLYILCELIVVTSPLPESTRNTISLSMLAASGPILAISCAFRAGRGLRDRRSRAWFLLMLGALFGAAANIATNIAGADRKTMAAAFGDISLMVALLLGILSMLSFPAARRRRTDLARMVLDGVVVGGSILFLTTVLVYPPLLSSRQVTSLADVTALAVPIEDVVAATLAVLLIMRSGGSDRPVLIMVSIGFSFYTVSDLAFALLSAQGAFNYGGIVDLGWISGYALLAVAARHPRAGMPPPTDLPREASPVAGTVIMFAVFIAAAFVGLLGDVNPVNNVLWLIALVAVSVRQILLVIDNNKLRQNLERRVAERTRDLRRLTERSELLLKSVGDGIYGVDTGGRITFINPAALRVLGYPPAELIGRSAHNTFHARHADGSASPENQCYVTEAVRDGFAAISEEDSYIRADGRPFPVEVTATPLTVGGSAVAGPSGSTSGAVVVFRDITQRREVDRIKNEFVSMVSHELRTPLTSIRGSLGLLAGGALGKLPERADHLLSIAQDSCERLTRLINDILDVERFESGSIPMEIGRHRASDLVKAAVQQVDQLATDSRITLSISRVDGVVTADADRVLQALINLISNAVKFSQAGDSVTIAAVPRGGFVEFSITDHGRGIPPDRLDSIFNRFEQVDSSDSRDKGGSGLGLAISRSIVERLGGRIWARSDPVRGTVFTFTLPRAERSEPEGEGDRPTVLVCDDDDYAVEVMCGLLEARGYHAIGVTDGREAINRALIEPPAVVVVDLAMPGTTGADVIAALGRHNATRNLPIVIVSGLSPTGNPELAAKASGWLVKPIDEERLAHTVRSALTEHVPESTVLLVEDDDSLSSSITARLERRGLTVHHTRSVTDALRICERARPNVVVLDQQLRDSDGVDLLTALQRTGVEGLAILAYNARAGDPEAPTALPRGRAVFLARGDVTAQQLEDSVIELLDLTIGGPTRAAVDDDRNEVEDEDDEEDEPKPRRALDVSATNP